MTKLCKSRNFCSFFVLFSGVCFHSIFIQLLLLLLWLISDLSAFIKYFSISMESFLYWIVKLKKNIAWKTTNKNCLWKVRHHMCIMLRKFQLRCCNNSRNKAFYIEKSHLINRKKQFIASGNNLWYNFSFHILYRIFSMSLKKKLFSYTPPTTITSLRIQSTDAF